VKITPGGSDVYLQPGEFLLDTESSISLEELISKYIFQGKD
jgi:phospholipid/cholesterol/gamma-HCH transport system substrate-binding protein